MTIRLTRAETSSLIRKALKEAFPTVKFSVKLAENNVNVSWLDGPTTKQVDAVVGKFEGSYFDSLIDYQGSIHHMLDGQMLRMGIDFVCVGRAFSDKTVMAALQKFENAILDNGYGKPMISDYRAGSLFKFGADFEDLVSAHLRELSEVQPQDSQTAARYIVVGDDGYSRSVGGGFSAVPVSAL